MNDLYLLLPVTALLPLTAVLLVSQADPYQVLILRGVLGVVAALVYALLGAADVALTEAMVGTLLSTTLYAVALRSSMVLRLAVPTDDPVEDAAEELLVSWLKQARLRLQLVPATASSITSPGLAGDLHGDLIGSRRLRLRNDRLRQRLLALEGASSWQRWGGEIGPIDAVSEETDP
jgi:putative multicomponent Na+:H+ antiporter subunit B